MSTETEQHKTFFGKLIAAIGSFFTHLVTGAKSAFEELPADQQLSIENGVNVAQIIKDGYKNGEAWVVNEVATKTGVSQADAETLINTALKDIGIDKGSIQVGLDALAAIIGKGITDNDYNGLWKGLATSAAQWLSSGKLDWISLSMGLIEWAVQHFIKSAQ